MKVVAQGWLPTFPNSGSCNQWKSAGIQHEDRRWVKPGIIPLFLLILLNILFSVLTGMCRKVS